MTVLFIILFSEVAHEQNYVCYTVRYLILFTSAAGTAGLNAMWGEMFSHVSTIVILFALIFGDLGIPTNQILAYAKLCHYINVHRSWLGTDEG